MPQIDEDPRDPLVIELAKHLARTGQSQGQLAAAAGVPRPNVSAILTGRRGPSVETLRRLARAAGLDLVLTRPRGR